MLLRVGAAIVSLRAGGGGTILWKFGGAWLGEPSAIPIGSC